MVQYYGLILDHVRDEIVEEFPKTTKMQKSIDNVLTYMRTNMRYNKTRFEGQVIRIGKAKDVVVWSSAPSEVGSMWGKSTVESGRF